MTNTSFNRNEASSLAEQFLTTTEKGQLKKLLPLTDAERLSLETLADYLIDAAIEDLQREKKETNLKVQRG